MKRRTVLHLLSGAFLTNLLSLYGKNITVAQDYPLRIGASLSLSGLFAQDAFRQSLGYRLWQEEVNAKGGLLGRQIELRIYDDGSEANRAAENYHRLVKEGVDLLLGPYGSIPSGGAVPVIEQAQIPCVIPMAANPRIWEGGRQWVVQLIPPAPTFMEGVAEVMAKAGVQRTAILYTDSGLSTDVAEGFRKSCQRLGIGVEFFSSYPFGPEGISRLPPLLKQVKLLELSVVGHIRHASQIQPILQMIQEAQLDPRQFVWAEIDEAGWLEAGVETEGIVGSGFWLPQMHFPGNQRFVEAFLMRWQREYPQYKPTELLDHHAPAGYAACQLTQEAVEAVGSLDRPAIRDYLFDLHRETVFGAYEVDETGKQIAKVNAVLQWQQGKREVVWPERLQTAELRNFPVIK